MSLVDLLLDPPHSRARSVGAIVVAYVLTGWLMLEVFGWTWWETALFIGALEFLKYAWHRWG